MLIAKYLKIIPPDIWYHDTLLKNNYRETVALILADNGILPDKKWSHDKFLENNNNDTVASYLMSNYVIPT